MAFLGDGELIALCRINMNSIIKDEVIAVLSAYSTLLVIVDSISSSSTSSLHLEGEEAVSSLDA